MHQNVLFNPMPAFLLYYFRFEVFYWFIIHTSTCVFFSWLKFLVLLADSNGPIIPNRFEFDLNSTRTIYVLDCAILSARILRLDLHSFFCFCSLYLIRRQSHLQYCHRTLLLISIIFSV